jgi:TolA-binding protein
MLSRTSTLIRRRNVPKNGRESFGLMIACCVLAVAATAQSSPYRDAYDAFQAGNYPLALEHLMHVYTNLQHSPAGPASGQQAAELHYNLGATYYRLERYGTAASQFRRITGDPRLGPRAQFNLGLIAARNGDREGAVAWFKVVADADACDELRARAAAKVIDPVSAEMGDAPGMIRP